MDFVRGVASLAVLQKKPLDSEAEFLKGNELIMLVADAKARIALYGSTSVVSSLAQFLRGGVVLDTPERAKEFDLTNDVPFSTPHATMTICGLSREGQAPAQPIPELAVTRAALSFTSRSQLLSGQIK